MSITNIIKDQRSKVCDQITGLFETLFPICRSITGNGVRDTLKIISKHIPINNTEVPTGTKVFDWEIPDEWNIRDTYIMDEEGKKIINFQTEIYEENCDSYSCAFFKKRL